LIVAPIESAWEFCFISERKTVSPIPQFPVKNLKKLLCKDAKQLFFIGGDYAKKSHGWFFSQMISTVLSMGEVPVQ